MPSPEKFYETLIDYDVPEDVIVRIYSGFEGVVSKTKKDVKARFFRQALQVMETELGLEKTREIFEANSCCKSGARLKKSKEFARINSSVEIEQKLAKIRRAAYMNMGSPRLDEHGDIIIDAVNYRDGDRFACACPAISRQKIQPESRNYCYCCAGHFKFHYEIMLDCKLMVAEILSSPLDSDGQMPCVIKLSPRRD